MTLPDLLVQAGYVLRGRNRATCVHCSGGDRQTVSYTEEFFHCHRCHAKGNARTLARQLGLLDADPALRQRLAAEDAERRKYDKSLEEFEAWREAKITALTTRLRVLGQKAELAKRVLAVDPTQEHALDALARFYHSEAPLSRSLDFLTCIKASPWLEYDSKIEDVYALWREEMNVATSGPAR